jgi:DNA invertase Pin-like site-specific DNA recombinase
MNEINGRLPSSVDFAVSMQELVQLGVAFVSVTDSIDLTTAAGQALAGMLSTLRSSASIAS